MFSDMSGFPHLLHSIPPLFLSMGPLYMFLDDAFPSLCPSILNDSFAG